MKTHTDIVVIGGGIGGCSTFYHLTQEGITDCVLIERDELTSGTTWHSAAQVTNFGPNQTMIGLKTHSIQLYKELADDPAYPINYHHGTGGLRLASKPWHMDGYRHFQSMAKGMGVEFEVIDAAECQKRHPLIAGHELLGALWDPLDGDIDPAQLCQALVRRARLAGGEVYRFNPVVGLTQKPDKSWIVHTEQGDIHTEKVVNAGGYRCNEVAAMMGVELPVASMEHQYFLSEPIAEIEALDIRVPLIRCPTDDFYSRQEKNGLLLGFYEQDCRSWGLDGIDPGFTMALCPDDLDRVTDVMEGAFKRLPCLETAGIHTIINGPITYTPDGLPLVGRIPFRQNAYCITGLRAGLGEGGGHGWLLAQMIANGEAVYDTWCLDPRRFTSHATIQYTAKKAIEDYQNEFRFHLPHEHREAGRQAKTTPLTSKLRDLQAEFAPINGFERATFFKPDPNFAEHHGFGFTNSFKIVAEEIRAVQERVGVSEISGFGRLEIRGSNVLEWLEGLSCSAMPKRQGRVALCYFLNEQGCVRSEATLTYLSDQRIIYGMAAGAEYHDLDWLKASLPSDGSIAINNLTNTHGMLVVAGPKARELLREVEPRSDWTPAGFPWLHGREMQLDGLPALVLAVSYSGETAFELHLEYQHLESMFDKLIQKGDAFGIRPFGLYAAESMRLEKGYRHWRADLITEYDPLESRLDPFVRLEKPFIGRDTLLERKKAGPDRLFVTTILDSAKAPAHPGASMVFDTKCVGTVTSAGYGHRTKSNIAMGFVDPKFAQIGTRLAVEVDGSPLEATVIDSCLYDPTNRLMRS